MRAALQRKLVLGESALVLLKVQDYPGNARELRNLPERAALLCDGDTPQDHHVQLALRSGLRPPAVAPFSPTAPQADTARLPVGGAINAIPGVLKILELAALRRLASAHRGSRAELARKLGISECSLYRKLRAMN